MGLLLASKEGDANGKDDSLEVFEMSPIVRDNGSGGQDYEIYGEEEPLLQREGSDLGEEISGRDTEPVEGRGPDNTRSEGGDQSSQSDIGSDGLLQSSPQYVDSVSSIRGFATHSDWRELVCSYDWPCEEAMSVLWCESRGDPNATNGESIGLMQIHYPSHSLAVAYNKQKLYDPSINIEVAHSIWKDSKWIPWSCKP